MTIEEPKSEVLGFGCGSYILLLLNMLLCIEFSCGVASARQSVLTLASVNRIVVQDEKFRLDSDSAQTPNDERERLGILNNN